MPNHFLNQCWIIVYGALRDKYQWAFNRNSYYFVVEKGFEIVVYKKFDILSKSQCVDIWYSQP